MRDRQVQGSNPHSHYLRFIHLRSHFIIQYLSLHGVKDKNKQKEAEFEIEREREMEKQRKRERERERVIKLEKETKRERERERERNNENDRKQNKSHLLHLVCACESAPFFILYEMQPPSSSY